MTDRLEGHCFVYVQGNEVDEEKFFELVRESKNDRVILYPERSLTLVETVCYRQYVKTVVTENPFIISSYDVRKVWVLKNGEWVNPSSQTYGASVNMIMCSVLNFSTTIPLMVLGGVKEIEIYKEKLKINDFEKY